MESTIVDIQEEITELKREKNAVILAHNYQMPEVQDLADFVGDSLGLSQEAAKTDNRMIVFCGVHFMAETASILCPEKKVVIPDLNAGCSLADTIIAEELAEYKNRHPNTVVVAYVNTTAAVKAMSDYCCTSSNAEKVVRAIPEDKDILFIPDLFLGTYIAKKTGRKMSIWPGECHVHSAIRPEQIDRLRNIHPDADFLIHPECGCVTSCMYYAESGDISSNRTYILSTEGMVKHAKSSDNPNFLVATETGILYRMGKEAPEKKFYPVSEDTTCKYMKLITPEKVLRSLRDEVFEVRVQDEIAKKAVIPIKKMLELV